MNFKNIILNKLLDKYEKSKALKKDINRKISVRVQEISEYNIENYEEKAIFNDIAEELKRKNLIDLSWQKYEERKYFRETLAY